MEHEKYYIVQQLDGCIRKRGEDIIQGSSEGKEEEKAALQDPKMEEGFSGGDRIF